MDKIQLAINKMKQNSFNKTFYQVDLPLDELLYNALRFLNRTLAKSIDGNTLSNPQAFMEGIYQRLPEFQRDNDKWTPEMQSIFVRNVLLGLKPAPLVFYTLDDTKSNCKLLDGLQRITSFGRFFSDPDMPIPFDDNVVLTAKELLESDAVQRSMWNLVVPLRIYEFGSDKEACQFYIDFNENITHSSDDILRAKHFLETL